MLRTQSMTTLAVATILGAAVTTAAATAAATATHQQRREDARTGKTIQGKLMRVNSSDRSVSMLSGDYTKSGQQGDKGAPAPRDSKQYTLLVDRDTRIHWKGEEDDISFSDLRDLSESAIVVPMEAVYDKDANPQPGKPTRVREIILTGEKPKSKRA